jgi:hypothetical protein
VTSGANASIQDIDVPAVPELVGNAVDEGSVLLGGHFGAPFGTLR